jgi:DNA-binding transcriptional regulator YbjK
VEQLKNRFMFGIPLVAPITKQKLTDDMIQDAITRATNQVEKDLKLEVFSTVKRSRLPFDYALYQSAIWCEVPFGPIQSVIRLCICSADYQYTDDPSDPNLANNAESQYPSGQTLFQIPPNWIDLSHAAQKKVFVNPISPLAVSTISTGVAANQLGYYALSLIGASSQTGMLPAFWTVEYLAGLSTSGGQLPVVVNEVIGAKAAILLLGMLYPLYRTTSQSLSIDGLGQSVGNQFAQFLKQRLEDLTAQYNDVIKSIKTMYGQKIFASNV